MLRAITTEGNIFVCLTRSSLELLEKGETLLSPGYEGGPDVVLVFAETDDDLRRKLAGNITTRTKEYDRRRS